jgi:hypothetical protein
MLRNNKFMYHAIKVVFIRRRTNDDVKAMDVLKFTKR